VRCLGQDGQARHLDDAERSSRRASSRSRAASGFVAPWAAILIGVGLRLSSPSSASSFVERIGIDDPIGAVAVHGFSGVWGTLATGIFAVPILAKNLATGTGGPRVHRLVPTSSESRRSDWSPWVRFTFSTSYGVLFAMHKLWGNPRQRRGRIRRPGTVPRARHVGLSRVLHPGSRWLRDRVAQPPRHASSPTRARTTTGPNHGACVTKLPSEQCTCPDPIVVIQAERKGAARSICARCGPPPSGFPFDSFWAR